MCRSARALSARQGFAARSRQGVGAPLHGHDVSMGSGAPVQYFQSITAIQLAVAGALLFQVRFFDTSNTKTGRRSILAYDSSWLW